MRRSRNSRSPLVARHPRKNPARFITGGLFCAPVAGTRRMFAVALRFAGGTFRFVAAACGFYDGAGKPVNFARRVRAAAFRFGNAGSRFIIPAFRILAGACGFIVGAFAPDNAARNPANSASKTANGATRINNPARRANVGAIRFIVGLIRTNAGALKINNAARKLANTARKFNNPAKKLSDLSKNATFRHRVAPLPA
jgi:hypothetical protein